MTWVAIATVELSPKEFGMIRNFLMMSGIAALTATTAVAQRNVSLVDQSENPYAQGGSLDLGPISVQEPPAPAAPFGLDVWKAGQLLRWGEVGKCVVARDQEASLSLVAATRGTPEAAAAA